MRAALIGPRRWHLPLPAVGQPVLVHPTPLSFSTKVRPPPSFVCSSCGADSNKWYGKCASCGEHNTVVEFKPGVAPRGTRGGGDTSWFGSAAGGGATRLTPLGEISRSGGARVSLGSAELDRLLGGGLTRGSSTLLCGAPGVGKSTLMLQIAALLCGDGARARKTGVPYADWFSPTSAPHKSLPLSRVAYVSGEESAPQIAARAERLGLDAAHLSVLNATALDEIEAQLSSALSVDGGIPSLAAAVIDSVQTLTANAAGAGAGSPTQVRESAIRLTAWAKATGVPVFLVGHVTKAGDIAGPRVLEHIVDTVLYMEGEEPLGDAGAVGAPLPHGHRMVRAIKNRFGSTSEVGLFEVTDAGFVESDSARLFLSDSVSPAAGCAVAVTAEGSRSLCVEVQALVSRALAPVPRLRAMGVPLDRLHLIVAVLAKFTRVNVGALDADVLVNVVKGLRLSDPATDLGVAVAVASSALNEPIPRGVAFVGEVGLAGELRGVARLNERVRATAILGFDTIYAPHASQGAVESGGSIRVVFVRTLAEVINAVFGLAATKSAMPRTTPPQRLRQ